MNKLLWALAVTASVVGFFYTPAAASIIIVKKTFKKINVPFIIISLSIFILSIFNFILLFDITHTTLIGISAKILTFITILMPAAILHLVIRFTQTRENKRYKFYIGTAYVATLIIFAIILTYGRIITINIFYGHVIYSPIFRYMNVFYILPIMLSTFFLTGRSIYRKLKSKESNLQVYYLLTGLLVYFIGTSFTQIMTELGMLQPVPVNELAHISLYIFIASSLFVVYSNTRTISEERIMGNIDDAVIVFNNEGEVMEMNKTAADIMKRGLKDKKLEMKNTSNILTGLSNLVDKETGLKKLSKALSDTNIKIYNDGFKIRMGNRVKYYNIRVSTVFNRYHRIMGKLLILSDITARKEKEDQLLYQSYHDKLTDIISKRNWKD